MIGMKKVLSLLLMATLAVSLFTVSAKELPLSDITVKSGATVDSEVKWLERGYYFGYENVDLTGMNSVKITAYNKLVTGTNGVTMAIVIDNPKSGDVIGYATLTKVGENITVQAPIKLTTGVHNLYFYSLYGKNTINETRIRKIELSEEKFESDKLSKQIPDSVIIDDFSDTWAATDDFGRKVASFEEAGAVKTDGREVGMLYWNWFIDGEKKANVIPEIISEKPSAKEVYSDPIWEHEATFYWGEPLLGFYTSYDYWVYRKHAEMLSVADVDVIFFDYSNAGLDYITSLNALALAFRDAKASGIDIPEICAMMNLGYNPDNAYRGLLGLYFNCFYENDYSDIWYNFDGKPLLYANSTYKVALQNTSNDNMTEREALSLTENFFTFRPHGGRNVDSGDDSWMWLENFPQILRNVDKETGRPEFVVVGCGINQSTEVGLSETGVFSDPYCKGRGYSEAFGEDYSENGKRMAYFFREQASLALEAEPEFVMIDGWNEWTALRQDSYNGHKNSFVDCFDYENSRDFEPNNGPLKDDYYMLLTDFIRKYKGVRETPLASGAKTIDVAGDIAQWAEVGPIFYNNNQNYERDSVGLWKRGTREPHIYKTTVNNAIKTAKVSFDSEKIYFMAECFSDIKTDGKNVLNLYINTDRNAATGWNGYDYAVNLDGLGKLSSFNKNTWERTAVGDAKYSVNGKYIQIEIARNVISETDAIDLEFKWTDSVNPEGNLLKFYTDGSVAPLGRFNYVYTEVPETSISETTRDNLLGTSILKAGSGKMIVSGAKRYVYEKDITVTPFEMNGTLYIPEDAYNEIMGYGRSKTEYDANYNKFFTYHFDLNDDMTEIVNYKWTCSVLDSTEVKVNGVFSTLSAPVKYVNGIFYIPASLISECYGYEVKVIDDGVYAIGKYGVSDNDTLAVLSHIN